MKKTIFSLAIIMLTTLFLLPTPAAPQEEVASPIMRYKQYEVSTGYYEEYEVLPQRKRPIISVPGVARGVFPYSPSAAQVRIRTRLVDSHQGIKFYRNLRCEACHMEQSRDIHTVRANLTCRQCHGGEPIASTQHYYSPMNPIRKHAYICAKCHEGAGVSFASYLVHPPNPFLASTRKNFPVLFYAFWIMAVMAAVTFVIFLPHTIHWGLRELLTKTESSVGFRCFYRTSHPLLPLWLYCHGRGDLPGYRWTGEQRIHHLVGIKPNASFRAARASSLVE